VITLALSKGRIFDETLPLLAAAGISVEAVQSDSRKLIVPTGDPEVRLIIVRASDVPTYVRDVLLESGVEGIYQPIDLGIARCRLCVAVPQGFDYAQAVRRGARMRVATKYVDCARQHFALKGVHVDLIKLYGSMELAPLVGLADAIVDVVSSGGTLRANRLVEVEEILAISARLIVNQASLKTQPRKIGAILQAVSEAVAERAAQAGEPS